MKKILPSVGILTFPIHESGIVPLSNLIRILYSLSGCITLITGNAGFTFFENSDRIRVFGVTHQGGTNAFSRIAKYIWTQIKFLPILLKISKDVDFFIFFFSDEGMFIPMLAAKFLRKKIVLALTGFSFGQSRAKKDILSRHLGFIVKINCILSNRITIQSEKQIKEQGLETHRHKILLAPEHFIDFNKFRVEKQLSERDELIGYIGRLTEEKGILNFVEAIPRVLIIKKTVKFLIGGDGYLRDRIEEYLEKHNLKNKVKIVGWVPHEQLSNYLNELKLLVLPSYTEGLPNIILEAMACGTPVLATAVGGIPDVVSNTNTGFLMEGNLPSCVAEEIIKTLDNPDLMRIAKDAKTFVEREFVYENAVERYKKVINSVMKT
ncbi:MAG: glycosyltransferase family 4 protein [Candidatus Bathyarchaeota archaeon]|nr:glycosyltransferase family 4 protein [Candidatus Bathyarchaeota archaeon]